METVADVYRTFLGDQDALRAMTRAAVSGSSFQVPGERANGPWGGGGIVSKKRRALFGDLRRIWRIGLGARIPICFQIVRIPGVPYEMETNRIVSKIGPLENRRKSRKLAAIHLEIIRHRARGCRESRRAGIPCPL